MLGRKRSRRRLPGAEKAQTLCGVVVMKKSLQPEEFDPARDDVTDAAIEQMLSLARQRLARAIAPIRRSVARVGLIDSSLGRLFTAESPRGLVALSYLDTSDGA